MVCELEEKHRKATDMLTHEEIHGKSNDVAQNLSKLQDIHIATDENSKQNNGSMEHHKISLMRGIIESRDPSAKEVDDSTLRRFLRARDLDVDKASALFLKYLKWRRSFVLNGSVSEAEIEYDLAANKMFLAGFDKQGRPINLVMGGRHFQNPKPGGLDEFKRFCVYSLDKICSRMPEGQEKYLGIADLQGWGYSNSDVRAYLGVLSLLQDCYPERLGKLFIVHAPRIFMAVWKVIYPFVDQRTKTKIVFVEDRKLKSTLLDHIDESQLPEIYGGKMPLVPIQDA